jgi:phosphohistidine phosphatase
LEARQVKRLWLLRHLKSSWDDPGLADHDRPLAPRGRKAGKRVRKWAAEHDVRPDLVLCSTAVRARATLDLVAPALGEPVVELEGGLYHAWADELLDRLRAVHPEFDSVLMIGHNPGFHNLVGLLAPPGPAEFPTGALAELRIETDDWRELQPGEAELVGVVVPRELRN